MRGDLAPERNRAGQPPRALSRFFIARALPLVRVTSDATSRSIVIATFSRTL